MEQDVLSPTVQHGSETDFRSQMPGSGGDFLQGPGDRSEQDIKKEGLVAESEGIQFVRKGEDDVEVGNRQERGQPFFEPIVAGDALALGTMAIAAGMEGDALRPQASHWSRCPPRAAVRHCRMWRITFFCAGEGEYWRQYCSPCARRMSASSQGGRLLAAGSTVVQPRTLASGAPSKSSGLRMRPRCSRVTWV